MGDADIDKLIRSLSELPRGSSAPAVSKSVAQALPSASPSLADALIAINVLRSNQGWDLDDTVDSVIASLALDPHNAELLRSRLSRILLAEPLWMAARAFDMGTAHPRSLQRARIVTDVRPLFGDDVTRPPTSAIISQTLILRTYDEDGGLGSLYISLDETDLDALQEQIERAEKKARSLRQQLEQANIPVHRLETS